MSERPSWLLLTVQGIGKKKQAQREIWRSKVSLESSAEHLTVHACEETENWVEKHVWKE